MGRLTNAMPRRRYRFAGFTLSPRGRVLLRGSTELPLIPRYFDLLVLLVERRQDAVHRRDIFDAVWSDVVVSDSALTQAIRTIRRALGDDPREPQFIRTVSRHGYRFVCADTVEEPDDGPVPVAAPVPVLVPAPVPAPANEDPREAALALLLRAPTGDDEEEESSRRDAAEVLHQMGTADALARLDQRRARTGVPPSTGWIAPAGAAPLRAGAELRSCSSAAGGRRALVWGRAGRRAGFSGCSGHGALPRPAPG
jgi:DNA-binding winged helix-turn-helix (wHTH) protein